MTIQEILGDALTEVGFAIRSAFSADEAIKTLDEPDIRIRALIVDIELNSKLTGWDVAQHARHITLELSVIYATASGRDWQEMGVPNSILISKPFASAQIVTALSQLLNSAPAPNPASTSASRFVADRIERFLNILQHAKRLPNRRELYWIRQALVNLEKAEYPAGKEAMEKAERAFPIPKQFTNDPSTNAGTPIERLRAQLNQAKKAGA